MAITLPTRTDAARYDFVISLAGTNYKFLFDWNERDQAWFMTISTEAGEVIWAGQRVVINVGLGNHLADARLPVGLLRAEDTTNSGLDPGFADLGDRVKLRFYSVDELNEIDPGFVESV